MKQNLAGTIMSSISTCNLHSLISLMLILSSITLCPTPTDSARIIRSLDDYDEQAVVVSQNKYDYSEVLDMSLLFYEAQRSGKLPDDNRIPWRRDSGLDDKGINGEDLTGGYYDAGDYVKFVWTQAAASTVLAWGLIEGARGYEKSGLLPRGLECLRWATDFLVKCHVGHNELYGQVGDFNLDQKFWGRPEDMNMSRPAYKLDAQHPGSDLSGEVSAALAAASIALRLHGDPATADMYLTHAKQLYEFATEYRGLYHLSMREAAQYYESTDYGDEIAWAAAWLFRATNNSYYLDEADHHYNVFRLKERPNEFFMGHRVAGVQVLLAQLTNRSELREAASAFCEHQAMGQRRSPKGLLCIERAGALAHAASVSFLCLQVANMGIAVDENRALAKQQIDYMLGDGGQSFVVGYGHDSPKYPHHAASSCPDIPAPCGWEQFRSKDPNPQILYGALVSGPNQNDLFEDTREEFLYSEVTIDYNSGFQSTLAMLVDLYQPKKSAADYHHISSKKFTDSNVIHKNGGKVSEDFKVLRVHDFKNNSAGDRNVKA